MVPPRLAAGLCALLVPFLTAPRARAHHVVTEHGIAPVMPTTTASLDLEVASFDARGRKGRWEAATPSLEWRAFGPVSLFAALPFANVRVDGQETARGIGDLSVSAKVSLYQTTHGELLVAGGLGAELPTGDEARGLGAGHVDLAPFLGASSAFASVGEVELVAYALTMAHLSLAGGHHHGPSSAPEGSILAPHGERELYARAMLAAVHGRVHLSTGAEAATVLHGDGEGQLGLRVAMGVLATQSLRFFAGLDATVAGEQRYGLRGRAGAAWMF